MAATAATTAAGRIAASYAFRASPPLMTAAVPFHSPFLFSFSPSFRTFSSRCRTVSIPAFAQATPRNSESDPDNSNRKERRASASPSAQEEEEVEEELPWIQEKALDLVEFTGSVTQAIPGPRVGGSSLPLILAIPMAYAGITFVISFVKAVRKFSSPREKRKILVNKNALLCESIDQLLEEDRDQVQQSALKQIMQKTGFDMSEILRKYIRYALNEKDFNPAMVANLIRLRKASSLDDLHVAEVLNEISRRIVRDKGPVVMDISGYSEKGSRRKRAVKSLFGKLYYLSELPEFCSRDSSLVVKEIFGVTDEDAENLRIPGSEVADMDSLRKMIDISDAEDSEEG